MSKIKGITEIQYEDDGKTIVYGSKNNKTRISVKNMTEEDIKEEFNFEKKILENQKTDLPNKIKNNEYVQNSMSSSLKEKDDSRKLLDSAKKNIEILESIVVPFYEDKLKEFKVEAVAEQKENKDVVGKTLTRVLNGEINSDEAAIEIDESGVEVDAKLYDELRAAEVKSKGKRELWVGDTIMVKGKNGNKDFEANFRGFNNDGKLVVVYGGGNQTTIGKEDYYEKSDESENKLLVVSVC